MDIEKLYGMSFRELKMSKGEYLRSQNYMGAMLVHDYMEYWKSLDKMFPVRRGGKKV